MKIILKLIIPIFILGIIFNAQSFVIGQITNSEINDEIKGLNQEIQDKRNRINKIQDQQKIYSEAITKTQSEKASLNNQLAILDNRLAKAELDIESAQIEIERINLEIKKTNLEIDQQNQEIENEKEHLANVLRLIYKQDRVSALEALLLNNTLAEFLGQVKYLEDMNEEIGNSLDDLEKYMRFLENEELALNKQNQELSELKIELEERRDALDNRQENIPDLQLEGVTANEKTKSVV